MNTKRKDFSEGKIISSKEEWENNLEDWMSKSGAERLAAMEVLRQHYFEFYSISQVPDMTVFGIRK